MTDADRAFERYCRTRQAEDLTRVFDVCAPQLLLFANHVAGDFGVAEDLLQMTFLRAIEGAEKFEVGRPVQPWLVGILVREARQYHRQAVRKPRPDRLGGPGAEPVPIEVAEMHEFQAALSKALDELPQSYREVLTLRLVHGLTPTEIAHLRGISPQTILTQLRRGTERLRKLLPMSFATAVMPLATTAYALAQMRTVVEQAADAAALTLAAGGSLSVAKPLAASAELTAVTALGAELVATEVVVVEGLGLKALAGVGGRTLAGLVAAGGLVTLGILAFAQDPQPTMPAVEDRQVLKAPSQPVPSLRGKVRPEAAAPAPALADDALASFTGRLLDTDGLGAADKRVEIVRLHPDVLVVEAAALPNWTGAARFLAGSTRTDERGRFTIVGVRPTGTLLLVLDAGGDRVDWRLLNRTPEPNEQVALGDYRLGRKYLVHGRIVDRSGHAVAGVRLQRAGTPWEFGGQLGILGPLLEQLSQDDFETSGALVVRWGAGRQVLAIPDWFRQLFERIRAQTVRTDDEGRFTWVAMQTGSVDVVAYADGFERRRLALKVELGEQDVGRFELEHCGRVAGVIVDPSGDPVPTAQIMLAAEIGEGDCSAARVAALSDAEGEFRAAWDHRQQPLVLVRRGPGEPWHLFGPLRPESRMILSLPSRFDLEIRVAMREGTARPEFRLLPGALRPETSLGVLTMHQLGCVEPLDLAGRRQVGERDAVKLVDVPAGDWILFVTAPGHATRSIPLRVDGDLQLQVELDPLEAAEVEIEDAAFRKLPGQAVFARTFDEVDRVFEFPVLLGLTNSDGVLPLARHLWRRQSLGTAMGELGALSTLTGNGVARVAIAMPLRGVIEGRLIEPEEPEADSPPSSPQPWVMVARAVPPEGGQRLPPSLSDPVVYSRVRPDGVFRFPGLEPGDWELSAMRAESSITHPGQLLPRLFPAPDAEAVQRVTLLERGHQRVRFVLPTPKADAPEPELTKTTVHGTVLLTEAQTAGLLIGFERGGRWRWFDLARNGQYDTGMAMRGPTRVAVITRSARPRGGAMPVEYLWLESLSFGSGGLGAQGLGLKGQGPQLDLRIDHRPIAITLLTSKRDAAEDMAVFLTGSLAGSRPGGRASCRFVLHTDQAGWCQRALPIGRYRVIAEHRRHGWVDHQGLEVQFAYSTTIHMRPLLSIAGHALPGAIGVGLPRGSKVEFRRIKGATELPLAQQVVMRRGALFDKERPFELSGMWPGTYRVTIHAALELRPDYIVAPEQAKIAVPQGVVEIGQGGRRGIVLRLPRKK